MPLSLINGGKKKIQGKVSTRSDYFLPGEDTKEYRG